MTLFDMNLEICFAHQSFKWNNYAKKNAGVTCAIIGVSNKNNELKYLYQNNIRHSADNISPYLTATQ